MIVCAVTLKRGKMRKNKNIMYRQTNNACKNLGVSDKSNLDRLRATAESYSEERLL